MKHQQNAPPRVNGHSTGLGHGICSVDRVANGRGTANTTYYTSVLGVDT